MSSLPNIAAEMMPTLPDPEHWPLLRAVLVLGYLAAAACWIKTGSRTDAGISRRWWRLGAFLLVLLAANKAFDFRTQCEILIRMLAKTEGWYERRQPEQFLLAILLPLVAGLVMLQLLRTQARPFVRDHPLVLPGWFLLLLYLALRQTQEWKPALHWLTVLHYDQWRLLLEVTGLVLVTLAALRAGNKQLSSTLDR